MSRSNNNNNNDVDHNNHTHEDTDHYGNNDNNNNNKDDKPQQNHENEGDQNNNNNNNNSAREEDTIRKTIFLHTNGDAIRPPLRFIYNVKQLRHFGAVLEDATKRLRAFVPITSIVTIDDGKSVSEFEEFEHRMNYVAIAGRDKFKKMDYCFDASSSDAHSQRDRSPQKSMISLPEIKPVVHSRLREPARFNMNLDKKHVTVKLFRNGDQFSLPKQIVLKETDLQSMNAFYKVVESRSLILPQCRPIRRLFKLDGTEVTSPKMISSEEAYCVASSENFIPLSYGDRKSVV